MRQLVNALAILRANAALTSAAANIGTTKPKAGTTATLVFQIDGVFKSKASTDDFWTLAGTTVAASSFQKYLLMVDTSGNASTAQGVQASTAAAVVLPAPPQSKCIAAVLTIATDASTTFVPGTTDLDASGITATYSNGFDGSQLKPVVLA
ncbi:MAG: hypothetical protein ABIO63_12155 [Casimicrobiaceae bacterium]